MASSSASQDGRRRRNQTARGQTLGRSNSILESVKSIFTNSFSWFTNGYEDSRNGTGKRRRLAMASTEPMIGGVVRAPKFKRIKVLSPSGFIVRDESDPPEALLRRPLAVRYPFPIKPGPFATRLPMIGVVKNHPRGGDAPQGQSSHPSGSSQNTDSSMESVQPLQPLPVTSVTSATPVVSAAASATPAVSAAASTTPAVSAAASVTSAASALPPIPEWSPATSVARMSKSTLQTASRPPSFRMRRAASRPKPVWHDSISFEYLEKHPLFVKPPPIVDITSPAPDYIKNTGDLLDVIREEQWRDHVRNVWLRKVDRENHRLVEVRRQKALLKAKAKAKFNQVNRPVTEVSRSQKAFRELDVYKTPLLPTRVRNGISEMPFKNVPDLFRPRKLVLMEDEDQVSGRKSGGKKSRSQGKHRMKPYPGADGMKKVLAQRKLELEKAQDYEGGGETSERKDGNEDSTVEAAEVQPSPPVPKDMIVEAEKVQSPPPMPKDVIAEAETVRPPPPMPRDVVMEVAQAQPSPPKDVIMGAVEDQLSPPTLKVVPPLIQNDWYSGTSGSSSSSGASSLRVGRTKSSRNHISRPTARSRAKSIAGFEDGDDLMLDQDQEREMLEEAAKKVPVFNIPANFSFAKDPIKHGATSIESLPSSIMTSTAPSASAQEKMSEVFTPVPPSELPPTTRLSSFSGTPHADVLPAQEMHPAALSIKPKEHVSSNGGVPNFFASSAAFQRPLEIKTPSLMFGTQPNEPPKGTAVPASVPAPSSTFSLGIPSNNGTPNANFNGTSLFGAPVSSLPVKDATNPFWDGEKKTEDNQVKTRVPSVFAQAKPMDEMKAPATPAPNLFSDGVKTVAPSTSFFSAPSAKSAEVSGAAYPTAFTTGGSSSTSSFFKPAGTTASLSGTQPASGTSVQGGTGFTVPGSGLLLGASSITDVAKSAVSLPETVIRPTFEPNKSTGGFGAIPSIPSPSTPVFSFGQQVPAPVVATPNPVISNKLVSFGVNNEEAKPASPLSFKFGASENETKARSPTPFNVGAPGTPRAAEKYTSSTLATAGPVPPAISATEVGVSTVGDVSKPLQGDRLVTSPKSGDQECKMEESPIRDAQQANADNKSTFSFGNPPATNSVLFGGPASAPPTTTSSFAFVPNTSSNPFAAPPIKESKSEGLKPFIFGQSSATASTNTAFTFGQTSQRAESSRPSTPGSLGGFGRVDGTSSPTTSGFNLRALPASNSFGQQPGGSAPNSPSTFHASSFNFGGVSGDPGSQPASPAVASANLPSSGAPFGAGATGFNPSTPSSPFSAPTQIAPSTSSGGTLFTIGAAPPPHPGRPIKKLPNRARIRR